MILTYHFIIQHDLKPDAQNLFQLLLIWRWVLQIIISIKSNHILKLTIRSLLQSINNLLSWRSNDVIILIHICEYKIQHLPEIYPLQTILILFYNQKRVRYGFFFLVSFSIFSKQQKDIFSTKNMFTLKNSKVLNLLYGSNFPQIMG